MDDFFNMMYGNGAGWNRAADEAIAREDPGSSGGSSTAELNNAKDCAESRIMDFCGSNNGILPRSLDQVIGSTPVNMSGIPVDLAKKAFEANAGSGGWDMLSPSNQKYYQNIPRSFIGSSYASIYIPTSTNGQPAVFADPSCLQLWQQNIGSVGPYGATWNGMLYSLGLTKLAASLTSSEAASFILQHEYAHIESPFHNTHPDIRHESTMFDPTSGFPKTADAIALMNMAAIQAQASGETFNSLLQKLAQKAGIQNVNGAKSTNGDC